MIDHNLLDHQPEDLLVDRQDGILQLSINRPLRCNAWTSALRDELTQRLNAADQDSGVRALILTGAGERAFCSGQDLYELETFIDGATISQWVSRLTRCYDAVRAFSKPLVAAVNGVAAGSGFQVTQFCDYVVAHHQVRMGQTEVNSGLPSIFGTWLMWERIGRRAIELALQGRLMEAHEAHQLGFVQEVVDADQVSRVAVQAAERLAAQPRTAFRYSKLANRQFDQAGYERAMSMVAAYYREAFDTGEPQAYINRFFEIRAARRAQREASATGAGTASQAG